MKQKFNRLPPTKRVQILLICLFVFVIFFAGICGANRIGYRTGEYNQPINVSFTFTNGGSQYVQAYWCAHYDDTTAKCYIGGGQYISFTGVTAMR